MSLLQRIFPASGIVRFRNPARDRATDAARFATVRETLATTLAGIDAEIAGLTRRRKEALDRASCVIGTVDACSYGREEADEEALVEAETQIRNANERLTALHAQRLAFVDLDERLVAHIGGGGSVA